MNATQASQTWEREVRYLLVDVAASVGATVDGGRVESGSHYLRVRYTPGYPDRRDFTIRVSTHRSNQSHGKFKMHPWDAEMKLAQIRTELIRRSRLPAEPDR